MQNMPFTMMATRTGVFSRSYLGHDKFTFLTATAVTVVVAARFLWNKRHTTNSHKTPHEDANCTCSTRLTETEEGMLQKGMPPVSTLTWLDGDPAEVTSILRQRLLDIVAKNPWLAGRIARRKDGHAYLEYSTDSSRNGGGATTIMGDAMLVHYYGDDYGDHGCQWMTPFTPPDHIAKELTSRGILLQTRKDHCQPLWKVIVLHPAQEQQSLPSTTTVFAVVVSMSHAIGDGHTFYQLYNAVMGTAASSSIPTLDPVRIHSTMQQQRDCLGSTEFGFWEMPGFAVCMMLGFLLNKFGSLLPTRLGSRWRTQTHYFHVDMDAIQSTKDDFQSATVPFVSTNDILTSWFFQGSKGYFGRMAINFRNRLDGHTDAHAGNYENNVLYRIPQDTSSPKLIRQSLSDVKRVVTASQPPTNRELVTANISIISNWSSTTKQLYHAPLFDVASLLPTTAALCIIFSARPHQLGVMVTGTATRMAPLLGHGQGNIIQGPLL